MGAALKRRLERDDPRDLSAARAGCEFESFWSGDIGFAVHRMPQIGEVQPGVWLASGFGGQGSTRRRSPAT